MPHGLERRHNTGQLHFITFSCYRRLPLLEHPISKDTLERVIEKASVTLPRENVSHSELL